MIVFLNSIKWLIFFVKMIHWEVEVRTEYCVADFQAL